MAPTGKATKILVIDDAADIREALKVHLENAGYVALLAEDAVVGGRIALEQRPDLVIVELQLPYMKGDEFVRALLADDQTRHIPVIFLTGDPEVHDKAAQVGAAACLAKPITSDRLLEVVALFV